MAGSGSSAWLPPPPEEWVKSDWVTAAEAAAYLRVSTRTVYRYVNRGLLVAYQLQGTGAMRIRRSDVERLLREREVQTW